MAAPKPYPVRLRGELREPVSRWLFLVKWLLVLPHIAVLFFLFICFFFTWLASLVAIAFTGRYPRSLFDFNTGVLRWTWRVSFYGYQALGTDRYPPFSLDPDPSYPSDLEADYPARLSQGLVLVKWWLLALPHYLIVALLTGGAGYRTGGLVFILVVIAGFINLFTGRYPPELFRLIFGLDQWVYRVAGYVALMTDEYPPFRIGE